MSQADGGHAAPDNGRRARRDGRRAEVPSRPASESQICCLQRHRANVDRFCSCIREEVSRSRCARPPHAP